jgi:hypothetical protein
VDLPSKMYLCLNEQSSIFRPLHFTMTFLRRYSARLIIQWQTARDFWRYAPPSSYLQLVYFWFKDVIRRCYHAVSKIRIRAVSHPPIA